VHCVYCRYAIVLNSATVIHEAFVTRALDFSNRPELYTDTSALNVHLKGKTFKDSVVMKRFIEQRLSVSYIITHEILCIYSCSAL
jgi:hypothetical protein